MSEESYIILAKPITEDLPLVLWLCLVHGASKCLLLCYDVLDMPESRGYI